MHSYLTSNQLRKLTYCFYNVILQQRVNASNSSDAMRVLAAKAQDADVKVQQLDKLRGVHDDYQKLSNELIPAAEKNLDELRQERARLTEAHEDVQIYHSCSSLFVILSCHVVAI